MTTLRDPPWLKPWVGDEVDPPTKNGPHDRSAAALRAVVEQFEVQTCERYRKRDLDKVQDARGQFHDETCCNYFVRDVCRALGVGFNPMRANAIFDYLLKGVATGNGWVQVTEWIARALANAGFPVVAAWENPLGPGHVAIVVPSRTELDRDTTFIAQAGAVNFAYGRLSDGFGRRPVAFFVHA